MDTELFNTLEFNKILNQVAEYTLSPLGEELVREILPQENIELVEKDLARVTELKGILNYDDPFPVSGLKDIRPHLRRAALEGNFLEPQELIDVAQTLSVARKIGEYFRSRKGKYPFLEKIAQQITPYPSIEAEITNCIDPSTGEVRDKASPKLAQVRKEIIATEQRVRKKLETMVKSLAQKKYLQEELITVREGRLVIMVKEEHRHRVKGLVHDQSATGATLFMEPIETLELNNQIRALQIEEKREIERILRHLTTMVRNELEGISRNLDALAQFDFIHAKAQFSSAIDGNAPFLNTQNEIEIIRGKHPLLVLRESAKDKVVPLDLKIGDGFNTLVISGPNAGGKTVALKTVGLLCLMTMCGLHIPADPSSDIAFFKNIFCAIGDQQSIENDLSTFSSHVEKLRQITQRVEKQNLVLIDEIGSGTDPEEGAALAVAVLEKLTQVGCLTIVTTHQGALKAFAHETEGVENGSMEFDVETLQPTYRFRLGLPGSSYAFEIAQRWGLSEELIQRSRSLVGVEKGKLENLLVDLERKMNRYNSLIAEMDIKQSQLDGLIKLYQEQYQKVTREEKALKKKALQESEEILGRANATVEQAIREIKEQQAAKEAIRESQELLRAEKARLKKELQQLEKVEEKKPAGLPLTQVKIGLPVRWRNYNTTGTILSEPDASGRVLIESGEVKVRVPVSELEQISISEVKDKQKPAIKTGVRIEADTRISPQVDVRGLRVDEAIPIVDKYLDQVYLAGLEQVYIIHGKGTGALREAIHQFLKDHPRVQSKRFSEWNQGDVGVTVVEMKLD